jgi:hypothetical protein
MDNKRKISVRIDRDLYDMMMDSGRSVSEVVNDALGRYFGEGVVEDGIGEEMVYLKNAMYWGNLKKYKEIVKYPTNMIYVD